MPVAAAADPDPAQASGPSWGPEPEAALSLLLQRMRSGSDFPALSARVATVQRLASSDQVPLQQVADGILQDVGLTQKLLRLVNSAHFRHQGHSVATITRAVALVGLAAIRNLALSLVLVEHMSDREHALRLKQAFARALLAGQLAHELARTPREAETAFLAALFSNLGALVTEVYFPIEAGQVHTRLASLAPSHDDPLADALTERVSTEVLGVGFEALGEAVASGWGLPEGLLVAMRRPRGASPAHRLASGDEYRRWLSTASNEAAAALWSADAQSLPRRLDRVAQRHGRALGLSSAELLHAAESARRTLVEMSSTLGLVLPPGLVEAGTAGGEIDTPAGQEPSALSGLPQAAGAAGHSADPGHAVGPDPLAAPTALALLSAGIQEVAATLASERAPLQPVLTMALETIYRALGGRRVVLCLRDADGSRLVGRLGLGAGVTAQCAHMQLLLKVPPGRAHDALARACLDGQALWVSRMADQPGPWPAWLQQGLAPAALIALPLQLRGNLLGLIYADFSQATDWPEAERALLRTLCSQVVLAFRPVG